MCSRSQRGCECKRARVKSGEPVTGLCCAPLVRVLLPGRHWLWLSSACPNGWLERGQVSLPPQALGQQRFSILSLWRTALLRGRNQVLALPISAERCKVLLHSCPCLGCCPQLDCHFWRGVFIAGMINRANDEQTQSLKKPKRCDHLLFISGAGEICHPSQDPAASVSPIIFHLQVGPVGFWSSAAAAGHSMNEGRGSAHLGAGIRCRAPIPHLGVWHQPEHFLWAVISVPLFCWPRASSCVFWSSNMSSRGNLSQHRDLEAFDLLP